MYHKQRWGNAVPPLRFTCWEEYIHDDFLSFGQRIRDIKRVKKRIFALHHNILNRELLIISRVDFDLNKLWPFDEKSLRKKFLFLYHSLKSVKKPPAEYISLY